MNYAQHQIPALFNRIFYGRKNFMTPQVIRFGTKKSLAYELSKGEGLDKNDIFGVTVINMETRENDHAKGEMFSSLKEAEAYIKSGFKLKV